MLQEDASCLSVTLLSCGHSNSYSLPLRFPVKVGWHSGKDLRFWSQAELALSQLLESSGCISLGKTRPLSASFSHPYVRIIVNKYMGLL